MPQLQSLPRQEGGGVGESFLAGTAAGLQGWGVPKARPFPLLPGLELGSRDSFIFSQMTSTRRSDLLHIDVLLGAGLEELKTWRNIRWEDLGVPWRSSG